MEIEIEKIESLKDVLPIDFARRRPQGQKGGPEETAPNVPKL